MLIKQNNFDLRRVLLVIFGALMVSLSARLAVNFPGTDVPQTLQTLALIAITVLLPARVGIYSVLLYLLLGIIGVPVFADGASGIEYFFGNTGGYLIGFLLGALYLEFALNYIDVSRAWCALAVAIKVHVIILLCGWLWLGFNIGYANAFKYGVEPFTLGAVVKSAFALLAIKFSRQSRQKFMLISS